MYLVNLMISEVNFIGDNHARSGNARVKFLQYSLNVNFDDYSSFYILCNFAKKRALRSVSVASGGVFAFRAHSGSAYNFLNLWSDKTGTLSERRMSELCRLAE